MNCVNLMRTPLHRRQSLRLRSTRQHATATAFCVGDTTGTCARPEPPSAPSHRPPRSPPRGAPGTIRHKPASAGASPGPCPGRAVSLALPQLWGFPPGPSPPARACPPLRRESAAELRGDEELQVRTRGAVGLRWPLASGRMVKAGHQIPSELWQDTPKVLRDRNLCSPSGGTGETSCFCRSC